MLNLRVPGVSAFAKPSASTETTTALTRGLVEATLGTFVCSRRGGAYGAREDSYNAHARAQKVEKKEN